MQFMLSSQGYGDSSQPPNPLASLQPATAASPQRAAADTMNKAHSAVVLEFPNYLESTDGVGDAGCCGLRGKFPAAVIAIFMGGSTAIITAIIAFAIAAMMSLEAVRDLAQASAMASFNVCHDRVSALMETPMRFADSVEFALNVNSMPLPPEVKDAPLSPSPSVGIDQRAMRAVEVDARGMVIIQKGEHFDSSAGEWEASTNEEEGFVEQPPFLPRPPNNGEKEPNAPPPPPPAPPASSEFDIRNQSWYNLWFGYQLLNLRNSNNFSLQSMGMGFADGQYVGCALDGTNASNVECIYSLAALSVNSNEADAKPSFLTQSYSKSSGARSAPKAYVGSSYFLKSRQWYKNTPIVQGAFRWSDISFSPFPTVPIVSYSRPVFNSNAVYVGTTVFMLELERLDSEFKMLMAGGKSRAYLLDNRGLLVASSLISKPAFVSRSVARGYALTAEETSRCAMSDPNDHESIVVCQDQPSTHGDGALAELYTQHSHFFEGNMGTCSSSSSITLPPSNFTSSLHTSMLMHRSSKRIALDGEFHFVMVRPLRRLGTAEGNNMNWRLVVLLTESEVTRPMFEGLNVAIIVTVSVVAVVAFLVGLAFHLLLFRPIRLVAHKIETTAFLSEEGDDGDEDVDRCAADEEAFTPRDGPVAVPSPACPSLDAPTAVPAKDTAVVGIDSSRKVSGAAHISDSRGTKKRRALSYLSEVATIQRAYWAMSDEIRALKAYIPEHVVALRGTKGDALRGPHHNNNTKPTITDGSRAALDSATGKKSMPTRDGGGDPLKPCSSENGRRGGDEFLAASTSGLASSEVLPLGISSVGVLLRSGVRESGHDHQIVEMRDLSPVSKGPTGEDSMGASRSPPRTPRPDGSGKPPPFASAASAVSSGVRSVSGVVERGGIGARFYHHDPQAEQQTHHRRGRSAVSWPLVPHEPDPNNDVAPPIFFGDNVLVDRDITIVSVNIVQFHGFVLRHHGTDITECHAEIVRFLHATARKCGGILENFSGDRFLVSFNATSKCLDHTIAGVCFALQVAKAINKTAVDRARVGAVVTDAHTDFRAAPCGVTCGVATGTAFVGPLGTDVIRRHTIISNAVSEAHALERMAVRYPNCAVLIGGDTIPIVEGYFEYILVDASLLPGSFGRRRRIASVKAVMCAEGCRPEALRGGVIPPSLRDRRYNPYEPINNAFNAFLEGRTDACREDVVAALLQIRSERARFEGNAGGVGADGVVENTSDGDAFAASTAESPSSRPLLTPEHCSDIGIICGMLGVLIGRGLDGRTYSAPLGALYSPIENRVLY